MGGSDWAAKYGSLTGKFAPVDYRGKRRDLASKTSPNVVTIFRSLRDGLDKAQAISRIESLERHALQIHAGGGIHIAFCPT